VYLVTNKSLNSETLVPFYIKYLEIPGNHSFLVPWDRHCGLWVPSSAGFYVHMQNHPKFPDRKVGVYLICNFEIMGCPALGIWVGFLKPPALPGEAPPKNNSSK
jgi:hypothetical protein